MIWRRIKKSTPEQEQEFQARMTEEHIPFKEKLTMVFTAYLVLVLPAILILLALTFLVCWLMGIF